MLYYYEASDKAGVIITGDFEALTKEAVLEYVVKRGLIPLSIREKQETVGIKKNLSIFERITPLDHILFVRNLAASLKAGLSIIEAFDILIIDASKGALKEIFTTIKANLQNGQPLSVSFKAKKKVFPPIFVGMLKAGEYSGKLDQTLNELARYLTREYNLKRKIRSALAYPMFLLVSSVAVIGLLLVFVLPRLTKTFRQSNADLPFLTKMLVKISAVFTYSPILDFILLAGLIGFFAYFKKTDFGRRMFLKIFFRIPVTRELIKKLALVRFTRTLSSLVSSGTPIIESLELAAESVNNEIYEKAIKKSIEQVKNGVSFSKTLENYPHLFPHFLTSLIVVGERTGNMEHILKTFADFYDTEVDHTLKNLTTFLEPLLLLFMGAVIGTIALSILLPIYQLVGKIQ